MLQCHETKLEEIQKAIAVGKYDSIVIIGLKNGKCDIFYTKKKDLSDLVRCLVDVVTFIFKNSTVAKKIKKYGQDRRNNILN